MARVGLKRDQSRYELATLTRGIPSGKRYNADLKASRNIRAHDWVDQHERQERKGRNAPCARDGQKFPL